MKNKILVVFFTLLSVLSYSQKVNLNRAKQACNQYIKSIVTDKIKYNIQNADVFVATQTDTSVYVFHLSPQALVQFNSLV